MQEGCRKAVIVEKFAPAEYVQSFVRNKTFVAEHL